jgi:diphthine synthase
MTATEGIQLLIDMEVERKEHIINQDDLICVVAQAGSSKPIIKSGKISKMKLHDFGPPLHTLVYPGKLHFIENEALRILSQ